MVRSSLKLFLVLLLALAAESSSTTFTIEIGEHSASTVSPIFCGVNIDAASLYQDTPPYRLAFNDERLINLSKTLAGEYVGQEERMVLRVGGSSADGLWWGPPSVNGSNQSNPYGGQRILVDQQ